MRLTKNEKGTLKILLENARTSDSAIAAKLHISSQAVGKIRRNLEKNLIDSYTLNLNYSRLGIKTFAIALSKLTLEGLDHGEMEIEQKLLKDPHVIQVYRLPTGNSTHAIFYGFQDMAELDNFFHCSQKKKEIHSLIENKDLFVFSHNSLIKNSPVQLFHKIIDSLDSNTSRFGIPELENFKRRL